MAGYQLKRLVSLCLAVWQRLLLEEIFFLVTLVSRLRKLIFYCK